MTDPAAVPRVPQSSRVPGGARHTVAPHPEELRATPRNSVATLVATGIVVAIAALAFTQSYARWLDPIIDTGRDLYIPEQIGAGAKLYREIRYQYPPLGPYVLALITAAFGHSLSTYLAIGLAQSAAVATSLWVALRRPAPAFAAALSFAAISFCGASTWGANFIFPYSYAATIGMALICVALASFLRAWNAVAVACLIAASWCKVEYALAAAVIIAVLAVARRLSLRQFGGYAAGMLITMAAAAAYFRDTRWISENVFAAWQHGARAQRFFTVVSGAATWREQIVQIAAGLAGMAVIALLLRTRPWIAIAGVAVVSVLIADHSFFRAWAVLQWAALLWALWRDRESPLLIFAVFSVACTLRIPLNLSPSWYGFVLTIPTFALAAYALLCYLPRRNRLTLLWLFPFVATGAGDLWLQHERYAVKQFPIVTSRGTFYDANPDRARIITELASAVHGGTLAVMPEGVTLNYLTHSRTPLTFHTFTPVEIGDAATEDTIVREMLARPPQRVAVVRRDVREYGSRGFGVDYGLRIMALLRARYGQERVWRGDRFDAVLLHLR